MALGDVDIKLVAVVCYNIRMGCGVMDFPKKNW